MSDKTTYYRINGEIILNRAKEYYENSKKKIKRASKKYIQSIILKRKGYKKRVWKK